MDNGRDVAQGVLGGREVARSVTWSEAGGLRSALAS